MAIPIRLSEVISKQAVLNVGTAGHVAHGKSTLVKRLTGVATQRFKSEKERNITIRLGYADAKIYRKDSTNELYVSEKGSSPVHHVSFVDCPGHELYMATMVSGSQVMDYCVVVIAANESIPQPQTFEHLVALDYSGLPQTKMIYLVNKLDLLKPKRAEEVVQELRAFLTREFPYTPENPSGHLIYPVSAATGDNMNYVLNRIVSLPISPKLVDRPARMFIVRSYNANKPSTNIEDLIGGIAGGSIVQGVLAVGDKVEIRPGVINMIDGKRVIQPLIATVETLRSDTDDLKVAVPGGLIGVGLSIYAGLTNDDRLKGQMLGHVGTLPDIYDGLDGRYRLLEGRTLPEEGGRVNIIVNGVMNVEAVINKVRPSKKAGRGDLNLTLLSPVVIDLNSGEEDDAGEARLAVMFNNKLVAALTVKKATLSLPIHYPKDTDLSWKPQMYEIENDLAPIVTPEDPDLKTMLSKITYTKGKCKRDPLPVPNISIINTNSYIHEKEFNQLLKAVTHDAPKISNKVDMKQVIIDNIAVQLANSSPRFNGEGNLTLSGRFKQSKMRQFLKDFESKILTCPSCTSTASALYRDKSGVITRHCTVCNIETFMTSTNMSQLMEVQ